MFLLGFFGVLRDGAFLPGFFLVFFWVNLGSFGLFEIILGEVGRGSVVCVESQGFWWVL